MEHRHGLGLTLFLLLSAGCSGGEEAPAQGGAATAAGPTYHRDVAPIVQGNCSACHRPGEAAPFPLLTYEDVAKRRKQIKIVLQDRFMPPWLPAPNPDHPLAFDRSLSDEDLTTFLDWIAAGGPEGDPADAPPAPEFTLGWQLGPPDIELAMPETYTVPAEGRDVYRNFVIPGPVDETTWVRTVEFRPDNRVVLHHAVMFVDGTGTARQMDRDDVVPGYDGMDLGILRIPDGQFIGWLPGKLASKGSDDVAFRLEPNTDIVLQLHLRPSGKPEPIRVRLGLHLADGPPTKHPMAIRIWSRDIDIPAGDPAYIVEESYELPVDVEVQGIYPHAHYLGDDLHGYATLPDGSVQELMRIPAWDFNWQEEYFYQEPFMLPKGTVLSIHYSFDNTSNNPLNPHDPPQRVLHGYRSEDEMAELLLQVLPREEERPVLWNHFINYAREFDLENIQRLAAEAGPDDHSWHHQVATYCLRVGRTAEAVRQYEQLVAAFPDRPRPRQRLGQARLADGDAEGALADLEAALSMDPNSLRTYVYLGKAREALGREDALDAYRKALTMDPGNATAHARIGQILAGQGKAADARRHLHLALERNPEEIRALWNLALLEHAAGKTKQARTLAERALHAAPDDAWSHYVLALVLEAQGQLDEAAWHLDLAVRFEPREPSFPEARARIRSALAERG